MIQYIPCPAAGARVLWIGLLFVCFEWARDMKFPRLIVRWNPD